MGSQEKQGLSDQVRALAIAKYVRPALQGGKTKISIRVKDLLEDLRAQGFPENHVPQICTALQGQKFQRENGLEIEGIEGPPSKMSTTVVINYRVDKQRRHPERLSSAGAPTRIAEKGSKTRADRLLDKIDGLLKVEIAAYGGGDAFLRWVRGEDEE